MQAVMTTAPSVSAGPRGELESVAGCNESLMVAPVPHTRAHESPCALVLACCTVSWCATCTAWTTVIRQHPENDGSNEP